MEDHFFSRPFDHFFGRTIQDFVRYEQYDSPLANVLEYEAGYEIEVAVPGMTRRHIRLEISNGVINVLAQKPEVARRGRRMGTLEFRTAAFQRSFSLPKHADPNTVKAKCKNGLLVISIQKARPGDSSTSPFSGRKNNKNKPLWTLWWHKFQRVMNYFFSKH